MAVTLPFELSNSVEVLKWMGGKVIDCINRDDLVDVVYYCPSDFLFPPPPPSSVVGFQRKTYQLSMLPVARHLANVNNSWMFVSGVRPVQWERSGLKPNAWTWLRIKGKMVDCDKNEDFLSENRKVVLWNIGSLLKVIFGIVLPKRVSQLPQLKGR